MKILELNPDKRNPPLKQQRPSAEKVEPESGSLTTPSHTRTPHISTSYTGRLRLPDTEF